MKHYQAIKTLPLGSVNRFCHPNSMPALTLDSPATLVVTDFTRRQAQIIDKDVSIDQALFMMKKGHVKSKLVVDIDGGFLGIVSYNDLISRKVLMTAVERGLERADLCVADVMVDKQHLHGIPYEKVTQACIGDVLNTLQSLGDQHILLLDKDQQLRGLISASDIARALQIPLDINSKAHSFVDIFKVLHDHRELA
ncbi:CBS domain-containing protein [Aliiglaciecola sp. CAU 1673]|uniref:CBS domain-containing protein n=1 Tax=Aliiglaciecola sp. CAU 1673 TaxID=3032595 RepID=UPI0023D9C160|nr:CBS domain-containing protein [Aliiglaciecola sp. CAU 1673]MDF2177983.1 CBS domain-containing protein [Aliiglaciecola sp. CAU 1673]